MSTNQRPKRHSGLRRRGHPGNPASAAAQPEPESGPVQRPVKARRQPIIWAAAMVFAVVTIAVAFSQSGRAPEVAKGPVPRSSAGQIETTTKGSLTEARAGDCISVLPDSRDNLIGDVTYLPCSDDHDGLVLGWTKLSETGTTELAQTATKECIDLAVALTGRDPNSRSAGYQLTIVPPENGLPSYLCLADFSAE